MFISFTVNPVLIPSDDYKQFNSGSFLLPVALSETIHRTEVKFLAECIMAGISFYSPPSIQLYTKNTHMHIHCHSLDVQSKIS